MSNTEKLGYGFKVTPRVKAQTITPLRDGIIVEDMKFGMQTTSKGLIILDDNGSNHGIKPRWARVYSVGPDQKDISVGQYILVEHGRWTRGIEIVDPETGEETVVRKVDNENILMVSDEPMTDMAFGNKSGA
jgi:co-chaperonin GroES (HSP10)